MSSDASNEVYYYVGDEVVTGIRSRIFGKGRESKYRFAGSAKDQIEKYTKKIWVGPAGEYLKVISTLKNGPDDDNETITQYTYSKNLKIEAPIK